MVQDVLVYIIILLAFINSVVQSIRIFKKKTDANYAKCPNCGIKDKVHHEGMITSGNV